MPIKFDYSPKNLHFYTHQHQEDDTFVNFFYLTKSPRKFTYDEIISNTGDIAAYIQFTTDEETDESQIVSINVQKEERGKGYSYYLMLKTFDYLNSVNMYSIVLDDSSDQYRKSGNLYLRLGFEYVAASGPEMFAELSNVYTQKNIDYFLEKWGKYYKI